MDWGWIIGIGYAVGLLQPGNYTEMGPSHQGLEGAGFAPVLSCSTVWPIGCTIATGCPVVRFGL